MPLTFEVRESDLLGRIGTLTVGTKRVETPCLFPVVHPVSQAISPDELKAMGFGGLMTNSYTIYKRRRDEALEKGIHKLLGFDGMVMTDSGGYQVLEYGDLDITYGEIASFQSRIGSNLAVTLDRPTGFSRSRAYARGTMEYSLKNAVATVKEFGSSETVWVGPVQGGLFSDLLRRSATELLKAGFRIIALGSPVEVMVNYRYAELVKMIVAARKAMPFAVPLHLFGAGHPHTMAISVALGCDTFDSASYILFAREGRYMTERGASRLAEMKYLPCGCPVCSKSSVRGLLDMEERERIRLVSLHNLCVLRKEVESCKEAITEGRLWDLVEERAAAHPRLQEAFRLLVRERRILEAGTPALKQKGLLVRGELDLLRPELSMAKRNLAGVTSRASKTALLIVSADPLPLGRLRFRSGTAPKQRCDVFRFHPVLGAYPAELDFVYPFTQTVASQGEIEGLRLDEAKRALASRGYSKVLVASVDQAGRLLVGRATSRRRWKGASPSPRLSSSRPRSPRRP